MNSVIENGWMNGAEITEVGISPMAFTLGGACVSWITMCEPGGGGGHMTWTCDSAHMMSAPLFPISQPIINN